VDLPLVNLRKMPGAISLAAARCINSVWERTGLEQKAASASGQAFSALKVSTPTLGGQSTMT